MAQRQKKTSEELRTYRQLRTPVSLEEQKAIDEKARIAKLSRAEYMRQCCLNKRIISRVDNDQVDRLISVNANLASLGNMLKLIFDSKHGFRIKDIDAQMVGIKQCRDELLKAIKLIQGKHV